MELRIAAAGTRLGLSAALLALAGCATQPAYYSDGDHGGSYYYGERVDHRVYTRVDVIGYGAWPRYAGYGWPYCCAWDDPWFWSGYAWGVDYYPYSYFGWNRYAYFGGWPYRHYTPYHRYTHDGDFRQRDWRHDRPGVAGRDGGAGAREQVEQVQESGAPRPAREQSLGYAPTRNSRREPVSDERRLRDDDEVLRWDRPGADRRRAAGDEGSQDRVGAVENSARGQVERVPTASRGERDGRSVQHPAAGRQVAPARDNNAAPAHADRRDSGHERSRNSRDRD